ncbi:DUF805 domain-containing protein [Neobacillus piezotolerans]|uniref:DUF805 domain-containing protein n=1 Tax=Neobacillus piezotolerans TaxID=2259171 RepID=A0A3D8GSA4_9BACI|nr:DUF805 domain-containing protein [Neobacillus piezotolerans]RDU37217.1 DUF805 domain-containing protein [Neobacillus piezotolerans]
MEWFLKVLKDYAVFKGRARRKEYWMFTLISTIIVIVLSVIEELLGLGGILSGLFSLAIIIPSLAVTARRLHDTGRSGWMMLLALIPLIGGIILLVFAAQDSKPGTNQYGPNPKEFA